MLEQVERLPESIDLATLEKSRAIAIMEERTRLSREMHDGLAQSLSYMNLQAVSARELLDRGEIDGARVRLSELVQTADETCRSLREALFCIRAAVPLGDRFFPSLREYLDEYRTHYGLEVQLEIVEGFPPHLPEMTTVQLYRIVLEALSNVRKHTSAKRARVRFEEEDGQGRVTVEDDGEGFELARVMMARGAHFGMQIMRERAESIGGSLEVGSRPGCGTQIIAWVPLE